MSLRVQRQDGEQAESLHPKFRVHRYVSDVHADTENGMSREEICSALSLCDPDLLVRTIDGMMADGSIPDVTVVRAPATGTVQLQVREPVCEERFIIADALATVAEVSINGTIGWSMRLGSDHPATLAAAIADAFIAQAGAERADRLIGLVHETLRESQLSELREWAEVGKTVIQFEELD